jgi:hypothetical protein
MLRQVLGERCDYVVLILATHCTQLVEMHSMYTLENGRWPKQTMYDIAKLLKRVMTYMHTWTKGTRGCIVYVIGYIEIIHSLQQGRLYYFFSL